MASLTLPIIPAALTVLFGFGVGASAQTDPVAPPWVRASLTFLGGQPVGVLSRDARFAAGGELAGRIPLGGSDRVALRVAFGAMVYGWESEKLCGNDWAECSWPRAKTSNAVDFGAIGPEISFSVGSVRPYLNALVGFGLFSTSTKVKEGWWDFDPVDTDNQWDTTVLWGFGAGFDVEVWGGELPVSLTFGAQYHRHGMAEYLTEGDIAFHPDGSVTLSPKFGQANFISYRAGCTIALNRRVVEH